MDGPTCTCMYVGVGGGWLHCSCDWDWLHVYPGETEEDYFSEGLIGK